MLAILVMFQVLTAVPVVALVTWPCFRCSLAISVVFLHDKDNVSIRVEAA